MTFERPWVIHRHETLPSTMDRAAELARRGAPERTAVLSGEQTAGRGRGGRAWHSPRGAALYTTLILRPPVAPERLSSLSLVIGVAVAEAIEAMTGVTARLKWPNDVWLGDDPARRKTAGILLTSSLGEGQVAHVLAGIGINVTARVDDLPEGGTSLLAATGVQVSRDALLETLLERIDVAYAAFLGAGGRPSLAGWLARAAHLGETVTVEEGGEPVSGVFTGIDDDGALLLVREDGTFRRVVAGDLVRGPRPVSGDGAAPSAPGSREADARSPHVVDGM